MMADTFSPGARPQPLPEQDQGVLELQITDWTRDRDAHQVWAATGKTCQEFYDDEQWTDADKAVLAGRKQPPLVLNKIKPLVNLILGYARRNRYDIKYMPGNDGTGSAEVAEILTAVAKQIAEANGTEWNDMEVFADGLITGRGFWDIRMDFARNHLGEVREAVLDPFSVYIDSEADAYAPSGWQRVTVNRWMSLEQVETVFGPEAGEMVASRNGQLPLGKLTQSGSYSTDEIAPPRYFGGVFDAPEAGWRNGIGGTPLSDHLNRHRKLVRVIDTQRRETRRCRWFVDLVTGQEKLIPDDWDRNLIARVMQWAQLRQEPIAVREGLRPMVKWVITAADAILYNAWSIYDDFTVVPFFATFRRGQTAGMVKPLLDAQRLINKSRVNTLHILSTVANAGWIYDKESLDEEMKEALEQFGAQPGINIEYDSKNGTRQPPRRIEPAAPPHAIMPMEEKATMDLKEIAQINDSALGQVDRVQSGRAIEARQRQSIMGAEIFFDNFSRSRELKGRRIKALIQQFYTEERLIRVRGDQGDQDIRINVRGAAGDIVNDVTMGHYDVAVEEAPASATFLQGQFEELVQMRSEMQIPIPDEDIIDASSVANKSHLKQRVREQRMVAEDQARLAAVVGRMQAGIPPTAPLPPVPAEGVPLVAEAPPEPPVPPGPPGMQPGAPPQAMPPGQPGQPLPPQGPPMGGPSAFQR
jgi:hypothetical protein